LKDGKGRLTAGSGIFNDTPYTFARRFEGSGAGTTPEELIASAHSGCYAMALSGELGRAGFTPQRLTVRATVTIEPVDGKATISSSALELEGVVPGIDAAKFQEAAANAKANCPVSRLLNTNITLTAKLAG
ncbi:MAG TPA: OsmC family peroxiredoxin, partial [Verrucomicrobiae bacterium]|nr:OsmC family peroxiredoxin [Verrucomicrobiae bacterium]